VFLTKAWGEKIEERQQSIPLTKQEAKTHIDVLRRMHRKWGHRYRMRKLPNREVAEMGDRVLAEIPTLADFEGDLTRLGPRRYHARLALLIAALVQAAELRGSVQAHARLIRQRSRTSDRASRGLPA
jgi:hypothetical protein